MNALADLLPRPGDEAFKYTSFQTVARREYADPAPTAVDTAALPAPYGPRLLFVDGQLAGDGSGIVGAAPLRREAPHTAPAQANALRRMNAALASECITIDVPADTDAGTLELLFVASQHPDRIAAYPQVAVRLGANARATVIERHVALGDADDFLNLAIEVDLERGAQLTHLAVQRAAIRATVASGVYATVAQDASFMSHAVHLGGSLARADIDVVLAGRGAHCGLYGLHLAGLRQHIDTHTRIEHAVADTTSDEHYRAVVDRGGRSVFNGKVRINEGADRSDARQYNANLLLSEQAEADTKPELEIYADDVKASHGATVGKLDESALFYLRTRGIGEDEARRVLVWAFADTVLARVPQANVRAEVEAAVLARMPDAAKIEAFR
ncbi:MAG: Fe-S cluster assembly protein SufD [Gammaproteobacteria bacterium]